MLRNVFRGFVLFIGTLCFWGTVGEAGVNQDDDSYDKAIQNMPISEIVGSQGQDMAEKRTRDQDWLGVRPGVQFSAAHSVGILNNEKKNVSIKDSAEKYKCVARVINGLKETELEIQLIAYRLVSEKNQDIKDGFFPDVYGFAKSVDKATNWTQRKTISSLPKKWLNDTKTNAQFESFNDRELNFNGTKIENDDGENCQKAPLYGYRKTIFEGNTLTVTTKVCGSENFFGGRNRGMIEYQLTFDSSFTHLKSIGIRQALDAVSTGKPLAPNYSQAIQCSGPFDKRFTFDGIRDF